MVLGTGPRAVCVCALSSATKQHPQTLLQFQKGVIGCMFSKRTVARTLSHRLKHSWGYGPGGHNPWDPSWHAVGPGFSA